MGQGADSRSIRVAEEAGYNLLDHCVRQLTADDFSRFDAILAMDDDNLALLRERSPANDKDRVSLFLDAAGLDEYAPPIVPDPYYEDLDAFRHVLKQAEQGVDGLIGRLRRGESLAAPACSTAR